MAQLTSTKKLVIATALLFLAHFIEELLLGFYKVDASTKIIAEFTGIQF